MPNEGNAAAVIENARQQLNALFGNMFQFDEADMQKYDACFRNVFGGGVTFSYMSATFYAQFAGEILVGALASNPFRRFLEAALDEEAAREERGTYWEASMPLKRFGLPDYDYTADMADMTAMMNDSYLKLASLNEWYGTPDGKNEFDMYCLSVKALRGIKRMIVEFPYLIRRFDFDQEFAGQIMEYAGIVAHQIREAAEGQA